MQRLSYVGSPSLYLCNLALVAVCAPQHLLCCRIWIWIPWRQLQKHLCCNNFFRNGTFVAERWRKKLCKLTYVAKVFCNMTFVAKNSYPTVPMLHKDEEKILQQSNCFCNSTVVLRINGSKVISQQSDCFCNWAIVSGCIWPEEAIQLVDRTAARVIGRLLGWWIFATDPPVDA